MPIQISGEIDAAVAAGVEVEIGLLGAAGEAIGDWNAYIVIGGAATSASQAARASRFMRQIIPQVDF